MADIKELREFDKMTRPVKFRLWKMLRQGLPRDVIKYKVFNILYKLHILKRYNYRTRCEGYYFPPYFSLRQIETENFLAVVDCKLNTVTEIEQDYFYKEKNGKKKILYVVRDETTETQVMTCYLSHIALKLDGKVYQQDKLPTIQVAVLESFNNSKLDEAVKVPQYRKITYDLSKIEKLRSKTILNSLSVMEVSYTYDDQCMKFINALKAFTLKDLEC